VIPLSPGVKERGCVLPCPGMRVFVLVSALAALLAAGCNRTPDQPDHQSEWRDVLANKKAAASPGASPQQKQVYADSVRAFVQKHPNHGRGREVWSRIQLEFADELASMGRYQDAVRFYRAVLTHDASNEHAKRGLADAVNRLAVTREKLLLIEKGMSKREVAGILGKPLPGWTEKRERSMATMESWYYRTRNGGLAAVYFREGRVLAAEESSHARVARLGS
jgi:hypothetical protein